MPALPRGPGEPGPDCTSVPVGLGREPREGPAALTLTLPCAYICHVCVLGTVACALVVSLVGGSRRVQDTVDVLFLLLGGHLTGVCYMIHIRAHGWMNEGRKEWIDK